MNYKNIYDSLMRSRKHLNRVKGGEYYEKHHIIPRSLGGDNSKDNLVLLTPREHYVAHKLLIRIYPKSSEMKLAIYFMSHGKSCAANRHKITSKEFSKARFDSVIARKVMSGYDETQIPMMASIPHHPSIYNKLRVMKCKKGKPLTQKVRRSVGIVIINAIAGYSQNKDVSYKRCTTGSWLKSYRFRGRSLDFGAAILIRAIDELSHLGLIVNIVSDVDSESVAKRKVSRFRATPKLLDFVGKSEEIILRCLNSYREAENYVCSKTKIHQKDVWMY